MMCKSNPPFLDESGVISIISTVHPNSSRRFLMTLLIFSVFPVAEKYNNPRFIDLF